MVDTSKLMVRVEREIPYSRITMREKIRLAEQTEREDLLEAVATDKSLKVRRALVDRVRDIPDSILGEYLLKDEDEFIRNKAREWIIDKKLTSSYYGEDGINVILSFLCKFFSPEFVLSLNSYGNKRKAMSVIYLYYMKYGCQSKLNNSKLLIFYNAFNRNSLYSRNEDVIYMITKELKQDEPWESGLYGVLKKLANYRYVPEQLDVVLARNLLSDECIANIEELKAWQKQTIPELASEELANNWINILAKTLYNLGNPCIEKNDRILAKCKLILNGQGTEPTNEAEEALEEFYKTSAEPTFYTKD